MHSWDAAGRFRVTTFSTARVLDEIRQPNHLVLRYFGGFVPWVVQDITLAGWFDHLPDTTPHKGLFGVWNHAFPSAHSAVEPAWARADWYDMVTAWFDRYLKGLDTGVEKWPAVQVQASDGSWRWVPWTTGRRCAAPGAAR